MYIFLKIRNLVLKNLYLVLNMRNYIWIIKNVLEDFEKFRKLELYFENLFFINKIQIITQNYENSKNFIKKLILKL